jgi:hypothetical protein
VEARLSRGHGRCTSKQLSGLPLLVVLAVAGVWVWKIWGLVALAVAVLVAVIIRLWGECHTLSEEVEDAADVYDELTTLEGANARLEDELDNLRRQLDAPSLLLPHLMHAMDTEVGRLHAVRKHRELQQGGLGEWLVTSIALTESAVVRVTAHADRASELAAGEPAVLVQANGDVPVCWAEIAPTVGAQIQLSIPLDRLPEYLQEDILNRVPLSPQLFVVRLAWLQFEPYRNMNDDEIDALLGRLMALSNGISQTLTRSALPSLEAPGD